MCRQNDKSTVCGRDISPYITGEKIQWRREYWCAACVKTALQYMARERLTKWHCGRSMNVEVRAKQERLMIEMDLLWEGRVVFEFMKPRVTHLLEKLWEEQIVKTKILNIVEFGNTEWPESVRTAWMSESWDCDVLAGTGRQRPIPPKNIEVPSDGQLRLIQGIREERQDFVDLTSSPLTPAASISSDLPPAPSVPLAPLRQSQASLPTSGKAQAGSLATKQPPNSSTQSSGLGSLTPTVQDLTTDSSVRIREADSQDATIQLDPPTGAGTRSQMHDSEASSLSTPTTFAPTMQGLGVDTQASSIVEDAAPTPTPAPRARPVVQPRPIDPDTSNDATSRVQALERQIETLKQQLQMHLLTPPDTPLVSRVDFPQTPTHEPTRQAAHQDQGQAADEGLVNVPTESEERLNRAITDYHMQVRDALRAVQVRLVRPEPTGGRSLHQYIKRLHEIVRGGLREVESAQKAVKRERRSERSARRR